MVFCNFVLIANQSINSISEKGEESPLLKTKHLHELFIILG